MRLKGYNIFLTGAYGHIGSKIAIGLAKEGANLLLNGRDKEKLSKLVREIEANNGKCIAIDFDINDEDRVKVFFDKLDLPLHGIVNNAYAGKGGTISSSTCKDFEDSYKVGVISCFTIMKYALPALKKGVASNGVGSIVNVSSMYGVVAPDLSIYSSPEGSNPPFYGAAKAALIQLTRYAASEFGGFGIRVNSITPGPFPNQQVQDGNPSFIQSLGKKNLLGRVGKPEELIGPLVFLLSAESSFVTGANVPVDGGWTAW